MDLVINHEQFHVDLVRKKVKKTRLSVVGDHHVQITSHSHLSNIQVEAMMVTYFDWIMNQLQTRIFLRPNQMMIEGTIWELCLDQGLPIPYQFQGTSIYYQEGGLDVLVKERIQVIESLAHQLSQSYGQIEVKFRKMKTRWGVCHIQKKRIVLNTVLVSLPQDCITYVIYHELTHFVVPSHQHPFYEALRLVCPNYKLVQQKMNKYVLHSFFEEKS